MNDSLKLFEDLKSNIDKQSFYSGNISHLRSFSFKYLKYRIFRPYLKLKYRWFQWQNPTKPWLTPDAIMVIKSLLKKEHVGLEYGSGRSTVFFSELIGKLYSIEHTPSWHSKVTEILKEKNIDNVELILREAETEVPKIKFSSEEQVFLSLTNYPIKDDLFKTYYSTVDQFEDSFFDFILIDGRARVSCSLKAIDKLKPGGIFVLDNSERRRYEKVHSLLKTWPSIHTTTGLSDTTIWRKPY